MSEWALAAHDPSGCLERVQVPREDPRDMQVQVSIEYCGVCHSDAHSICGDWPIPAFYPMVPGHEIIGRVHKLGADVPRHLFKEGDPVGVGAYVGSCRQCQTCKSGEEHYCDEMPQFTYNSVDSQDPSKVLRGGFAESINVDYRYIVSIPEEVAVPTAAPLLCGGLTSYSALKRFGAHVKGEKMTVGIAGMGGVGHIAMQVSRALGNQVTGISIDAKHEALADKHKVGFLDFSKSSEIAKHSRKFDIILNTFSSAGGLPELFSMLKTGGSIVQIGLPPEPLTVNPMDLTGRKLSITGSTLGSVLEAQEVMALSREGNIAADIELIHCKDANRAIADLLLGHMKKPRYVLDIKNSMKEGSWQVSEDKRLKSHDHTVRASVTNLRKWRLPQTGAQARLFSKFARFLL